MAPASAHQASAHPASASVLRQCARKMFLLQLLFFSPCHFQINDLKIHFTIFEIISKNVFIIWTYFLFFLIFAIFDV